MVNDALGRAKGKLKCALRGRGKVEATFFLVPQELRLRLPNDSSVIIIWRRRNRRVRTASCRTIRSSENTVSWTDLLCLTAELESEGGKVLHASSKLTIFDVERKKSLGHCVLNLTEVLDHLRSGHSYADHQLSVQHALDPAGVLHVAVAFSLEKVSEHQQLAHFSSISMPEEVNDSDDEQLVTPSSSLSREEPVRRVDAPRMTLPSLFPLARTPISRTKTSTISGAQGWQPTDAFALKEAALEKQDDDLFPVDPPPTNAKLFPDAAAPSFPNHHSSRFNIELHARRSDRTESSHSQLLRSHDRAESNHSQLLRSQNARAESNHAQLARSHDRAESNHSQLLRSQNARAESNHAQLARSHDCAESNHAQLIRSQNARAESNHSQSIRGRDRAESIHAQLIRGLTSRDEFVLRPSSVSRGSKTTPASNRDRERRRLADIERLRRDVAAGNPHQRMEEKGVEKRAEETKEKKTEEVKEGKKKNWLELGVQDESQRKIRSEGRLKTGPELNLEEPHRPITRRSQCDLLSRKCSDEQPRQRSASPISRMFSGLSSKKWRARVDRETPHPESRRFAPLDHAERRIEEVHSQGILLPMEREVGTPAGLRQLRVHPRTVDGKPTPGRL